MLSAALGEEGCRSSEPGGAGGWVQRLWEFAVLRVLREFLLVRASGKTGRLPEPGTHFQMTRMKKKWEKLDPVHLLSEKTPSPDKWMEF